MQTTENPPEKQGWLSRKITYIKEVFLKLLTQGISPEKISIAMTVGFTAGTFPILGTHTIIAIGIAFIFRLNQLAVYLGTWLSAPLFFLMLLPSLRAGEFILGAEKMDLSVFMDNLKRMFHSRQDFIEVWINYGLSIAHIIVGWIPLVIAVNIVVYFTTLFIARAIMKRKVSR